MSTQSVPFPLSGLNLDPITSRMMAPPCWNGRHAASEDNLRNDYADRRVCQRSACQCHCHHDEEWYVKPRTREEIARDYYLASGQGNSTPSQATLDRIDREVK